MKATTFRVTEEDRELAELARQRTGENSFSAFAREALRERALRVLADAPKRGDSRESEGAGRGSSFRQANQ